MCSSSFCQATEHCTIRVHSVATLNIWDAVTVDRDANAHGSHYRATDLVIKAIYWECATKRSIDQSIESISSIANPTTCHLYTYKRNDKHMHVQMNQTKMEMSWTVLFGVRSALTWPPRVPVYVGPYYGFYCSSLLSGQWHFSSRGSTFSCWYLYPAANRCARSRMLFSWWSNSPVIAPKILSMVNPRADACTCDFSVRVCGHLHTSRYF